MKTLYYLFGFLIIAGIGISAYWATASGIVQVFGEKISLSQSSYTVKMNESSVNTRNITVSTTSEDEIDVEIKVLPADYSTAEDWGTEFVAFAIPEEVRINESNSATVTIIHYSEASGNYRVKIIAAR